MKYDFFLHFLSATMQHQEFINTFLLENNGTQFSF